VLSDQCLIFDIEMPNSLPNGLQIFKKKLSIGNVKVLRF